MVMKNSVYSDEPEVVENAAYSSNPGEPTSVVIVENLAYVSALSEGKTMDSD